MVVNIIGRWEVECDPDRTAACYSALPVGTGCDCSGCRNFMAAIDQAFPPAFRQLASTLGVDLRKPAELAHYCREDSGLHVVGGWFHAVGTIRSGDDAWRQTSENSWQQDFERLNDGIEFGFTAKVDLVRAPFDRAHTLQLEFLTRVPWITNDPEPQ